MATSGGGCVCQHCGGRDIDRDPSRGDAVCRGCGSVLEDQIIVSEVQFVETSAGGSAVVGQHVGEDETGQQYVQIGEKCIRFSQQSQEITLQNARRRIQHQANMLGIRKNLVDIACNYYKMALLKHLTKGRRSEHVAAACLYLACRAENSPDTPHMLLDFSDVTQADVFSLGRTYLKLARELCIAIKILDPCWYIERFAHKLEFKEKTHEVTNTALRLLQRMQKDWMAQGRHPQGLCGAALLISARIHNFNRTIPEIVKVVNIGETTLRKRLMEFERTASSALTVDEFTKIDLEDEADPPCFTEGKQKVKLAQMIEENNLLNKMSVIGTEITNMLEEALERKMKSKGRKRKGSSVGGSVCSASTNQTSAVTELELEFNNMEECNKFMSNSQSLAGMLDGKMTVSSDITGTGASANNGTSADAPTTSASNGTESAGDAPAADDINYIPPANVGDEVTLDDIKRVAATSASMGGDPEASICGVLEKQALQDILLGKTSLDGGLPLVPVDCASEAESYTSLMSGPGPSAASLGLKRDNDEDDKKCIDMKFDPCMNADGSLYCDDIDDAELDKYILTKEEVIVKTKIWVRANIEYLKEQRVKQEQEMKAATEIKTEPVKKKRKRAKRVKGPEASTAEEAFQKVLKEKKISHKINYDVLREMNTADTTTTPQQRPLLGSGVGVSDNSIKQEKMSPASSTRLSRLTSPLSPAIPTVKVEPLGRFKKPLPPVDKKPGALSRLGSLDGPPSKRSGVSVPSISSPSTSTSYPSAATRTPAPSTPTHSRVRSIQPGLLDAGITQDKPQVAVVEESGPIEESGPVDYEDMPDDDYDDEDDDDADLRRLDNLMGSNYGKEYDEEDDDY